MLLGEHLGRRHERALVATLHGSEQRGEGDDGLARPDLTLEQPVHGRGRREVGGDVVDRAHLVVRERERKAGVERGHERPVDLVADPARIGSERALALDQRDLHAEELVELEAVRGDPRVLHRVGTVDVPVGVCAVDELERGADVAVDRVGEPFLLRPLERRRDRASELPGVHLRLPRLRIHGHDRAGCLRSVGGTALGVGRREHVDDGIGELTLAAVLLDLAEERDLRAHRELPLAPRLIEEHQLEQAGAVVDDGVDDGALAVAGAARPDRTHFGVDGRLVTDRQLCDLGALGAIDVAPRVVVEEIEHRRDAHLREPGLELGSDRFELVDPVCRELPQGEPVRHRSCYSTPTRYG